MARLFQRLLIFSIPFLIYGAAIAIIDPFNFLGTPSPVPTPIKKHIAQALNECFWKMEEFDRHPVSRILLGDSRMDNLPVTRVEAATGKEYFNFGVGGGAMKEMMDMFWFASRRTRLTEVDFGLNLNVYNDYDYAARTKTYTSIRANPALYFVNRTVVEAAAYDAYSAAKGVTLHLDDPGMSRDAFWRHQIDVLTAAFYTNYVYPVQYHRELVRMADYCKANGIALRFIIFPTHVELQNRIHDFHLDRAAAQFRADLAALGPVYDFDYANDITRVKENFSDPYHYRPNLVGFLVGDVWRGEARYVRRTCAPSCPASRAPAAAPPVALN